MAPKTQRVLRSLKNEVKYAWAAGFFDGEGWIGAFPRSGDCKRLQLRLSIGQTDRQVLDKFQEIVGFGTVRGPYNQQGAFKNPQWKFEIRKQSEVIEAFQLLAPFLSPVKIQQGSLAISNWIADQKLKWNRDGK